MIDSKLTYSLLPCQQYDSKIRLKQGIEPSVGLLNCIFREEIIILHELVGDNIGKGWFSANLSSAGCHVLLVTLVCRFQDPCVDK